MSIDALENALLLFAVPCLGFVAYCVYRAIRYEGPGL